MQRKVAIIVVAVLVIGAGVYFMMQQNNPTPKESTNTSTSSSSTAPTSPAVDTQEVAATITYSGSGFLPEKVTVKSGQSIAIRNDSSTEVQFDSDPHPIHTTNKELNVEIVAPGEVKTFTVTKTGTFGYHNHLNPSQEGTIVVE